MSSSQQINPFTDCPTLEVLFIDGDRLPELIGVLKDVDLTGFTVKLTLERPSGLLSKTAVILDALNGKFKFAWDVGDLEDGVGQTAIIRATDPFGLTETLVRFFLDVGVDPEAP